MLFAKDLTVSASIAVGARPWGIALSPDGRYAYTANGPSNDVSVVDTHDPHVTQTIKAGKGPWGVATLATTQ
jgi:YVTN family beta-propeller protein